MTVKSIYTLLNVKTDFGAVGNDSADDTISIQLAINQAVATKSRLFFPEGTYKITSSITIPLGEGFEFEGTSRGSVIIKQYKSNEPILHFTKAYTKEWRISGLSIILCKLSY